MKSITFEDEYLYDEHKVLVWIGVQGLHVQMNVEMVIDTGASISVFNRELTRLLTAPVESGEPIELVVANRDAERAYIHEFNIDFLGRSLTIPAAICPDWNTANLLGMRGFLDQMVIAFDHAQKRIYF
jgi:hypothetical protein